MKIQRAVDVTHTFVVFSFCTGMFLNLILTRHDITYFVMS